MNPVTGVAMYIIIWWVALFAVLPFGTRPGADADSENGWRGVPDKPRVWMKVLVTSLVSAVIWAGCYLLITSHWLSFRTGWLAMPAH